MYCVLHIADFALQAVLRTEPLARRCPAALFAENTKKSVVLAANRAARNAGVQVGMTAPQSVARCPTLVIHTPNGAAEAEARAALIAVAFTVSPSIEATVPGVCTIDIAGAAPPQHHRSAVAAVRQLEALGFIASAGIGATPLLALYAAREASLAAREGTDASTGTVAPSVAEAAGPYAAPVLAVSDPAKFLRALPIATADPTAEVSGVLANWGVHTLGELTALSRDDVGRRLGPDGLAVWDRAQGGARRPLHHVAPPQSFGAAMAFEHEIETLEPLLFILRRLLDRLTLELRTAGYVAASLQLTLRLADDGQHQREFRLPEPTADVEILFRAVHAHLETLRTDRTIGGIELRVAPTRPLVRQHGLFDTGLRDPHGFADTLARVTGIVGSDRVGTPHVEDTHRPDAVKLTPPPPIIPAPAEAPVHASMGPPLRRFRPPLRAQLELTDGRPTYLWTERFNGPVAELRGPWLSSGDWWQTDRAWRRTEYDVSLSGGGLYRLVLSDQAWFVEGEYD